MAAFSRLQLAKALIEYDNDPENTSAPQKNADQSAIFAHMRRTLPSRQMVQSTASVARRSTDYLGVTLPADAGSSDSLSQHRRSQASIDALRNPFGRDSTHEGHVDDEELEVDLSSWGLDAFAPTEKSSKKKKGREDALPNPHPLVQGSVRRKPTVANRTMSMGNLEQFGEGGVFLDSQSAVGLEGRRYSVGSPLDYVGVKPTDPSLRQRRASSGHELIDSIPITPPLHAVQFPSSDVPPLDEDIYSGMRPSSRASLLDPARARTFSSASMGVPAPVEDEPNPFAIQAPDRGSRFDPKYMRSRTMSNGTITTQMLMNDVDAESGREREMPPDTLSARAPRSRPISRLELMRPKVLIMPSPLQGSDTQVQPESRDGFQLNTLDGPPLPPEAKTGRRSSMSMSMMDGTPSLSPSASYGFTPNPRSNMTLSQLTFRNTLTIDGQRDVTFADIDEHLRRATEDGEQVDWNELEQQATGVSQGPAASEVPAVDDPFSRGRNAGKLYGTSLIDKLQARKAEMKGKARVFRGDERPSMMARTPLKRSSTLIDPESLKQRPISRRFDTAPTTEALSRKNSASHRKTLINFDDEIPGAPKGMHLGVDHPLGGPGGQTRSVFGVDTIWERELAKLRDMEAQEKEEVTEAPGGRSKKGKGKRKGKERERDLANASSTPSMGLSPVGTPRAETFEPPSPEPRAPSPVTKRGALRRPPPPPVDGDEEEEEDDESDTSSAGGHRAVVKVEDNGWHSDSDDGRPRRQAAPPATSDLDLSLRLPDDLGPRRTTGAGPRYANLPPRLLALQSQGQLQLDDEDDSEEDLPLAATISRAAQRATRILEDDSSDEDRPLTALIDKAKIRVSVGGGSLFGGSGPKSPSIAGSMAPKRQADDEDDQPLGLRVSRMMTGSQYRGSIVNDGGDEDDKPLGLRPEQMRRSQMFAASQMAQQQQQQQQMMMQAHAQAAMHQSMIFGAPSIMSAPFYGPQMAPQMMVPPQLSSTPPPPNDTAKLNMVDAWRRDVAVEGDP